MKSPPSFLSLPFGIFLEILVLLASWYEGYDAASFFQAAARLSGRVSLVYFAALFFFGALHLRLGAKDETYDVKYLLFRNFAVIHTIHLGFLLTYLYFSGAELVPIRLAGGMLAYALILSAPFLLAKDWKVVPSWLFHWQNFYFFWVWLVFFMTYLGRLNGDAPGISGWMETYYILMTIVSLMPVVFIFLVLRAQKGRVP